MKKILLSIFSLTLLMSMNLNAQSQRLVLVEEFTQASCPPCETTTPELNATLEANADKVVQLRYQTSWPGVDPMNADNPGEVQARVDYYGVTGVPNAFVAGVEPTGVTFPTLVSQANIDEAYAVSAPVKIEVTHVLSSDLKATDVTVTITNEGTEAYAVAANRLRVALVEEVIKWSTPPGSTSILDYEYVMKTFLTTPAGMELPEVAAGDSWSNTWSVDVPNTIYNFNEFAVVAFIQNDDDKSVVNAGKSDAEVLADYPDLAAVAGGSGSAAFCDYAYTPGVTVSNLGGGEATGYSVSVNVNGAPIQTIAIAEALAPAAEFAVAFDEVQLEPGDNLISYTVESNNGDVASNNNASGSVSFAKATTGMNDWNIDFEDVALGEYPTLSAPESAINANVWQFKVFNQEAWTDVTEPIGGFGGSEQALAINFYQWNPATADPNGSITFLEQYLAPDVSATLFFEYAFTTWGGSNDQMLVEVSTDCGTTWTSLFDKSGADLATTAELNTDPGFLIPVAEDWRIEQIDLSSYAGETVLMRFRVVTGWGDMMWIDNIRTESVSSNEELVAVRGIEVFPNPAADFTNITFQLKEAKTVTFDVIDNLGRLVASQDFGTLSGSQNLNLDLSELATGVYTLRGQFGDETSINKISVTK